MSSKKFDRIVKHPKLYMMVDGKLTHVPAGETVSVSQAEIDGFGAKLVKAGKAKASAAKTATAPAEISDADAQKIAEHSVLSGWVNDLGKQAVKDAKAIKTAEGKITSLNLQVKALTDASKKPK